MGSSVEIVCTYRDTVHEQGDNQDKKDENQALYKGTSVVFPDDMAKSLEWRKIPQK